MFAQNRVPIVVLFALLLHAIGLVGSAQSVFAVTCGDGSSPDRREDFKVGSLAIHVDAAAGCRGVRAGLEALQGDRPQFASASPSASRPQAGSSTILSVPIFCRRDDYVFLPADALGGIPCLSIPQEQRFDPYPLAVRMAAERRPPDLRIGMNPAKGMVHVPTWFWVEGYDGGTLSQSETVLQRQQICNLVSERGPNGLAELAADGRPRTRLDCHNEDTTFEVQVRLWPSHYTWDFGDKNGKDIACAGIGNCTNALGLPYIDAQHESPIQHPYVWSSLGVNGSADAYTVQLAITFAADYRVSINGQDQGGWQSLASRTLTWSASHKVQEAQAVLTRACPVTVAHC